MPLNDNSSIAADTNPDDTEARMRKALGIDQSSPSPTPHDHPPSIQPSASHTAPTFGRRRFVRDGEVPVTVLHREHGHGHDVSNHPTPVSSPANRLEIAEANLRAERQAREQAERSLAEAQSTIHDLQTKLGHERLAQDELRAALDRTKAEYHAAQGALAAVQAELATVQKRRQKASMAPAEGIGQVGEHLPKKRGRKPGSKNRVKEQVADDSDQDVVEWWVPGWQDRYR